ncbi:hybrid sensor histidine kinase/response regulator transcription factor [Polaribacter atrinae]|uniref:hybrid sensor histidine kinase/response regulator transcription factor n=1 Tax=Polaribacter atrinae TaxID=1333662 RepID=UPI00248FEF11|nr:ATP-binding protein [Polaribacter atrinae]
MGFKKRCFLFFVMFIIGVVVRVNGQSNLNIKHISPLYKNKKIGISQIAHDSIGNIWMSSGAGILRYNGYSYNFIDKKEVFPEVDSNDRIHQICTDYYNNIWIKTTKGLLTKYNSRNGVFTTLDYLIKESVEIIKPIKKGLLLATTSGKIYTIYKNEAVYICTILNTNKTEKRISSIDFDGEKEFFISTYNGKVFNYSLKTKRLEEIIGDYTGYPGNIVLEADDEGKLWMGTEAHGLFVYNIKRKTFIQYSFLNGKTKGIVKEFFISIFYDSNGFIWCGTDGGGLYKINSKTGEILVYKNKFPNHSSISSNTIMNISEDLQKNIWLVTNHGHTNVIPKENNNVNYHKGSISSTPIRVLSIYKSNKETLWIGTDGNGLTMLEKNKKPKEYFNDIDNNFYIQSLTEDDDADLWFGTYRNGLWKFDAKKALFSKIPVINKLNQKAKDVRSVFKDSKGRIWVGSIVSLNIYSKDEKLLASFNNKQDALNGVVVESIIEDHNNTIWLGQQNGGLYRFNENSKDLVQSTFTHYVDKNESPLPRILDMSLGKEGEIWFINQSFELKLFNTKTATFYEFKNLFPNKKHSFTAIEVQDSTNLWLSSFQGIHHFNTDSQEVTSYYSSEGFQEEAYILRSGFKDKEGQIYFGGAKGINFFNPKKLQKLPIKKPIEANLFVTSIDILNKPAKQIIPEQITSEIFNVDHLNLKYNQSSFTIQFAAIGNIINPNYNYSYRLKGFDKDWKSTYSEVSATYTNIPSGNYVFEIKANEINQPLQVLNKQISITISPPFWQNTYAYIFYLLILFIIIFTLSKWFLIRRKLLINKISRRQEKEFNKAKMNFFTKMSHEIQTPITLILGPIDNMLERAAQNGDLLLKERLNIIANNARRLSRIARDLTLVRNKDLNRLKLSVTQNNLKENIDQVSLSFKELARIKNIDFTINCPNNIGDIWYDKDKMEHILYNILGNSFKYTPKEGNIILTVKPINKKEVLKISISDSGSGIPKEELEDIFKLFYRSTNKNEAKGTGIGLALTKELVTLHKGRIKVSSSKSEGTTFTFKLPVSEDAYSDDEKITSSKKEVQKNISVNTTTVKEIVVKSVINKTKKTILVVEDNFELQNFLQNLLIEQYNVILAENGKEGSYLAKNNLPNLIISDVMMPEMDGIEMCEVLSKDNLTKHIPVILLTAKNSTQAKITGLKTGAIEYINKPFNSNELLLKIKNIIAANDSIISKYRKELINSPKVQIDKSQDELFLESFNKIVNERLSDSNFKVEELSDKLNMSHSSLYRKCSSLTGLSLIDYIRQTRLNKAAVLLAKYGYNISEVAYMVGFNNPKYFSKSFKSQFNATPKSFKNKACASKDIAVYLKDYNIDVLDFE